MVDLPCKLKHSLQHLKTKIKMKKLKAVDIPMRRTSDDDL